MAEQSALQKGYQKFFNEILRKYGVTSQAQIKNSITKKQFFKDLQEGWQKRRRRIKDPEQLKTKFTAQYLKHIKRRFNLPKNDLESGMFCELRYSTINKKTGLKNPPKKYFVLILHPNWKKKMHALRLDFVKPMWTKKLVNEVGLVTCTYNKACVKLNVQQLLLEEKDSKKFYIKELKKNMTKKYNKI